MVWNVEMDDETAATIEAAAADARWLAVEIGGGGAFGSERRSIAARALGSIAGELFAVLGSLREQR